MYKCIIILVASAAAAALAGCCKEICDPAELQISFRNFKAVDTDTVLLVRYQRGAQNATDTSLVVHHISASDTTNSSLVEGLFHAYDWKVIIPSLNRQYFVTDMQTTSVRCCGQRGRKVDGYKLNSTEQQGDYLVLE